MSRNQDEEIWQDSSERDGTIKKTTTSSQLLLHITIATAQQQHHIYNHTNNTTDTDIGMPITSLSPARLLCKSSRLFRHASDISLTNSLHDIACFAFYASATLIVQNRISSDKFKLQDRIQDRISADEFELQDRRFAYEDGEFVLCKALQYSADISRCRASSRV